MDKKERIARVKRILLPRSEYYRLDGRIPVPCDRKTWAEQAIGTHVAVTENDGLTISTVFLGLDHSHGGPDPMLFETMIFGPGYSEGVNPVEYQTRCSTWEEAEEMHAKACKTVGIPWMKPPQNV